MARNVYFTVKYWRLLNVTYANKVCFFSFRFSFSLSIYLNLSCSLYCVLTFIQLLKFRELQSFRLNGLILDRISFMIFRLATSVCVCACVWRANNPIRAIYVALWLCVHCTDSVRFDLSICRFFYFLFRCSFHLHESCYK